MTSGQIVILNGPPRSGKSSIAAVIQNTFEGVWMNLGVDRFMPMTPERYQPGIGLLLERRRATWGVGRGEDGSIPEPVSRWQDTVHTPGIYDMEVDTSVLSAEACAAQISQRLEQGPPPAAFERLAESRPVTLNS